MKRTTLALLLLALCTGTAVAATPTGAATTVGAAATVDPAAPITVTLTAGAWNKLLSEAAYGLRTAQEGDAKDLNSVAAQVNAQIAQARKR